VTVTSRVAADKVRLHVSKALFTVVTSRSRRTAVVATAVWSHGGAVVIRAAASKHARLRLRVALHRLPSPVLLVRKRVAVPGVYTVQVIVSARSSAANRVTLQIGAGKPEIVTARRGAPATVTAHVTVAGVLAIRASGRRTRPHMKIQLAKLITAPAVAPAPAPAPVASAPSTPVPTGVPGSWHLIFDDEFNGSSLDTSYWSTGWFGSGTTVAPEGDSVPECYAPGNVVEANDELDLNFTDQSSVCDGSTHPDTSGIVTTDGKFSFTYGLVEFRVWLPTTSSGKVADWPDLWTAGQSWPADGEIDVAEGLDGSLCAHYHGPNNAVGTGAGGGSGCPAGTFTGGWHTFAADWEPGIVTWYYDGQDIGCLETSGSACGSTNTTIAGAPMYIILSLGSTYAYPVTAPTTMRFADVRVWQH
jgi:beta-glucanase (GH16 family)